MAKHEARLNLLHSFLPDIQRAPSMDKAERARLVARVESVLVVRRSRKVSGRTPETTEKASLTREQHDRELVSQMCAAFDGLRDEFSSLGYYPPKGYDPIKWFASWKAEPRHKRAFADFFQRYVKELTCAIEKTDEQCVESYAFMNLPALKRLRDFYKTAIDVAIAPAAKIREKVHDAKKSKGNNDFGLDVVGLVLYHPPSNAFVLFEARQGFFLTAHGTNSLDNVGTHMVKRVRKAEEFLEDMKSARTLESAKKMLSRVTSKDTGKGVEESRVRLPAEYELVKKFKKQRGSVLDVV